MSSLSHIDPKKGPQMVDVGGKVATQREAVARARVAMSSETLRAVVESRTPKGDVLSTARIAGIMAAKRTPELIPLCHPLPLTYVGVELTPNMAKSSIEIEATVRTTAPTGVEME
ncbi:MAG: cyclic pyranopterin monophosphate synthase MoaC, partial [Chloroflexi bacterium]|nr:cyclic pyranopterin monophosphate synthase MoaC [Chloroflexota bacterium]